MTNDKTPKNADDFICNKCNFKCSKMSDYKRHTNTSKHARLTITNDKTPKNAKSYSCVCGKVYIHSSSLCKHKNTCTFVDSIVLTENPEEKPSMMDILSQNKELMNLLIVQNQEHREETNKLHNTILELVPKIGNNNNNTTNNNQFNLQVFLNEDCKDALNFSEFLAQIQVSFEDLENQAENGYIKGISKLFIESLQELGQNKRPIHCSDKKRKTIYIKEDNEWDKECSLETLKNGINEVTKRTLQTLKKEKENNAEEYKDGDSEFSMKCLNIQRNLFPSAPRETTIGKVIENITQNSGIV
jgi:hypothetical protein